MIRIEVAHIADAQNGIAIHRREQEYGHGLDSGNQPGGQVEVLRVLGDGLIAPLQTSGQEPGETEDHPPDGRGHAKEVGKQEDQGARVRTRGAFPEQQAVAGDLLVLQEVARQVAHCHHEVAGGEEDNGPLRVLKPFGVDDECG